MTRRRPSPAAIRLYEDFHKFEPMEVGDFPARFKIPKEMNFAGAAEHVLYRSDKLNPTTLADEGVIDYIHEHKRGVVVLVAGGRRWRVRVPKYIWSAKTLVYLGECLGFAYRDDEGEFLEAKVRAPRPELFAIPSGKALLVIEGRRKVEAIIFGGKLGVEPRGIVG